MTAKLDDLKRAHHTLMVEYVNILNQVSKLPLFVDIFQEAVTVPQENAHSTESHKKADRLDSKARIFSGPLFRLFTWRFFVRLFVESHIKRILNQLGSSYVHLAQRLDTDEPSVSEYQIVLKQAEESATKFANTLSSWHSIRGLVSVLWPLVISLLAANLGRRDPNQAIWIIDADLLVFIVLLVLFLIYFCIYISFAFAYKRMLFFPGSYSIMQGLKWFQQQQDSNKNVYQIEDRLFNLLEKGKPREFPVDIASYVLGAFIFGGIPMWLSIEEKDIILFLFGCFFVVGGIVVLIMGIRRKWR